MEPASDADLEAIFEHIDFDQSGSLSVEELRAALSRKGLSEAETEVRVLPPARPFTAHPFEYECTLQAGHQIAR